MTPAPADRAVTCWLFATAATELVPLRPRATRVIESTFPRKRLVKFRTRRLRGTVDPEGAQELADELGRLPLALAQAASVIVQQALGYHAAGDAELTR